MRIIFFGTPEFAVPSLEALLNHPEFEVLGVVTQPDKKRGRGNQLMPNAVKKIAVEHEIPVWQPKSVKKNRQTLTKLETTKADAFVVVAYGQILSQEILAMAKLGCINVHGSILPKYRGAAPIQWSIYHGESKTGITTMMMDEGLDTGDMLLKAYTKIGLLDNSEQIALKLAHQGSSLLIETLEKLTTGDIQPMPQDDSESTYAPLIKKSDYIIDWTRSAIAIHNQIRAFFPDGVTTFRGKSLKIMATIPLGEAYWADIPSPDNRLQQDWEQISTLLGKPGEIVKIVKKIGAIIQTGQGLLILKELQLAGKKPQSSWDFVNGMRLTVGEILGNPEA